jgi:hypothetical protein
MLYLGNVCCGCVSLQHDLRLHGMNRVNMCSNGNACMQDEEPKPEHPPACGDPGWPCCEYEDCSKTKNGVCCDGKCYEGYCPVRVYFFSCPKDFPNTVVVHFTCVPTSHLFCIPGCCFPCAAEALGCDCVRCMRVLNVKRARHVESCCVNSGHARTQVHLHFMCDI